MADVQLDDKSDITLSNITDKIKKADQTAKEMYTRLDRFMESSARKEKNAKDEASLSKSKETKSNDQAQRDPVTKQEAPEAIKDTNTDELVNSVMGEVSDQLGKANLQADTLEIQEDLNTKTILNAVSDQNKQTLPPVVQGEVEMSESKEPQQSAEQTVPSKANAAGPIEINVIADTKQSIKTDKTEPPQNVETGEPLATPNIIEPIEPLVTTTAPVATNSPEKTKLDMPEVSQTPIAKAPPVQESSVATLPEVFEPQVPEMSPASNVVEDFIKAPQDAAPDISMPEAVEAPAEPFVASKGSASPQEFPNIIASTQAADQGSSMNLADESLVTIEKSLDNMSQQMKQNQEKLVSSLSNLNNTAMEILKILPTLQQRGSDQPMKVSSNSQTHSIDASNMIGNFRDSLNLTTKGYSRNTVFPGNNSIT